MSASANRELIETVFEALAQGDGRPFDAAMAEDVVWRVTGSGPWSRAYRGKAAVRDELQRPVFANFGTLYRCRAERILVDGDTVVVLAHGEVTTKAGKPYNNDYCFVIGIKDGRIAEVVEYMDTALVDAVLAPPA